MKLGKEMFKKTRTNFALRMLLYTIVATSLGYGAYSAGVQKGSDSKEEAEQAAKVETEQAAKVETVYTDVELEDRADAAEIDEEAEVETETKEKPSIDWWNRWGVEFFIPSWKQEEEKTAPVPATVLPVRTSKPFTGKVMEQQPEVKQPTDVVSVGNTTGGSASVDGASNSGNDDSSNDDNQPEEPGEDNHPEKPGEDNHPEKPGEDNHPEEPGEDNQPEEPGEDNHPEEPGEDNHPEQPGEDNQPEEPVEQVTLKVEIGFKGTLRVEDEAGKVLLNEIHNFQYVSFEKGLGVVVTVSPKEGYKLIGWNHNNEFVPSNGKNFYVLESVEENTTLEAVLGEISEEETFNLTVEKTEGGSVILSHKVAAAGTEVMAIAIPRPGFVLAGWRVNGKQLENVNPMTIVVTGNMNFEAIFEKMQLKYCSITVEETEGGKGNASETRVVAGEEVSFWIEDEDIQDGYEFSKWEFSDGTEDTEATCKKVVESDLTAKPVFQKKKHSVTLNANIEGADVSFSEYEGTSALVQHGDYVTANAPLMADGSQFSHFIISRGGKTEEVELSTIKVEVTTTTEITAVYKKLCELELVIFGDGKVTTMQNGKPVTFDKDNSVFELPFGSYELLAYPEEGSYAVGWFKDSEGKEILGNSEKYQLELNSKKVVYVFFAKKDTVKVSYLSKSGTVLKSAAVERGKALEPSTNTTLSGMTFVGWTIENGGFYEKVASSNDFVLKDGTETLIEALERLTADESVQEVKIRATYVEEERYYALNVEQPGWVVRTDKVKTDKGYPEKTHYYLDVQEDQIPEGEMFSSWVLINEDGTTEILSYKREYDGYLLSNMTLRPTFSDKETEEEVLVGINSVEANSDKTFVKTTMTLELPSGYKLSSWGYMYQTENESLDWTEDAKNKVVMDNDYRAYTYDFKNYDWFKNENLVTLRPFAVFSKSDSSMPKVKYGNEKTVQCEAKQCVVTVKKDKPVDVKMTLDEKELEFNDEGICEVSFKYGTKISTWVDEEELAANGLEFADWRKDYPDKPSTRNLSNPCLSTVASDMTITLRTREIANSSLIYECDGVSITFIAENGEILKTEVVNAGETSVAPQAEKSGRTFVGWTIADTLVSAENLDQAIKDITATGQNVQAIATYEPDYCSFTVTGGSITEVDGKQKDGKYEHSSHIFIKLDEVPEGEEFVCWELNGLQISMEEAFDFHIMEDCELKAIYRQLTEVVEPLDAQPLDVVVKENCRIYGSKVEPDKNLVVFTATCDLPEEYRDMITVALLISPSTGEAQRIECTKEGSYFDWKADIICEDYFRDEVTLQALLVVEINGEAIECGTATVECKNENTEEESDETIENTMGEVPVEGSEVMVGTVKGENPVAGSEEVVQEENSLVGDGAEVGGEETPSAGSEEVNAKVEGDSLAGDGAEVGGEETPSADSEEVDAKVEEDSLAGDGAEEEDSFEDNGAEEGEEEFSEGSETAETSEVME